MNITNRQSIRNVFDEAIPRLTRLAGRLNHDPDSTVARASQIYDDMSPDLAYAEDPHQPLAAALFTCTVNLSLFLALEDVDAHEFGSAMLTGLSRAPVPPPPAADDDFLTGFAVLAEASQNESETGRDVFDFIPGKTGEHDWGYNVKSCAICHQYAKYDAMDLVPYMCATDDVMSDKGGHGLRRTGSIALGADHCDFRYRSGGEPHYLADQYPDRIRWVPADN